MARRSAADPPAAPPEEYAAAWAVERHVELRGWRVRYREAGAGPPLVLVHGLGISADFWGQNAPAIAAAGHRVVAPDLPGFGRTDGPRPGLDVRQQADFARELAGVLGLGPAVFLGHSISCQTVLELGAASPGAVRGLILGAPTEPGGAGMMARQAGRILLDAGRERPSLLARAAVDYLRAGPVRYWRTWRWGDRWDPLGLAPSVPVPALVLRGTRDPVVPEAFARRLAAALPRGRYLPIEGAAHSLSFDEPGEYNRAVVRFLREVESGKC